MEQSRDREEKREGGGSQRANKQIREEEEGFLVMETEGMSKRWRMEIGLDGEAEGGSSFTQHPRFRHVATSVLVT